MLRSMYSAISGLKNFQTQLDVIGNNIANVNTTGFKKGTVNFQDILSQETSGASAPTASNGGINPIQVGLGSQIATINNDSTQGSLESTGRSLDQAISGDGYFVVQDGSNDLYTRDGNFYLDSQGNLVTGSGQKVMGYGVNSDGSINTSKLQSLNISNSSIIQPATGGPLTLQSYSIGSDGKITGVLSDGSTQTLGQIVLATFNNPEGLEKEGDNLLKNTSNSGNATIGAPGTIGGTLSSGTLEMSNVDLSEEFTNMIEAQRGFQANAKTITTADQIMQTLIDMKQ